MLPDIYIYASVFATSFLASTILPLGSEGVVALAIRSGHNAVIIVLIASVGNFLGSLTNYYVGYYGEKTILSRLIKITEKDIHKAKKYFDRHGSPILFFSWLPIVGDALTLFAGIIRADLKRFTFFVFTGKLARYIAIAFIFG
ncbi:MAG: YqaA family protein [archaeon]